MAFEYIKSLQFKTILALKDGKIYTVVSYKEK